MELSRCALIFLLLTFAICDVLEAGRLRSDRRRNGRNQIGGSRRRPHGRVRGESSRANGISVSNWLNALLGEVSLEGSVSFPSSSGSSFLWSINGNPISFPTSASTTGESITTATSTTVPEVDESINIPWRGKGSFTGDLRIDCKRKKNCYKGSVQVFNREEGAWGNICGRGWGRKEAAVVCNYLKFKKGAKKHLRLKKTKLSINAKRLSTFLFNIRCNGTEAKLTECNGEIMEENTSCELGRYAGVVCSGKRIKRENNRTCPASQSQCANQQMCIESRYVCDGTSDCPWGSDELNCGQAGKCERDQFWCGPAGGGCISASFKCDGDNDCVNGTDEVGCVKYLRQFVWLRNAKLQLDSDSYNSGWRHITPYSCAKKCREATDFKCVSFDYQKDRRECDLTTHSSKNARLVRPSALGGNWDHYELRQPRNCNGFRCKTTWKCIPSAQVCDGQVNCRDRSDEANCTTNEEIGEPLSIRLSSGLTQYEGHLEVKRGSGSYGLVCDVGWTINEAHVACRQLGFRGALMSLSGQFFRRSLLSYKLSDVRCTGRENNLDECEHGNWNEANCLMDHEAGVVCLSDISSTVAPSIRPTTRPSTTARTTERTTTITTRPTTTQTTTVSPISRCGVKPSVDHHARPRIVGGNYADANEWPWQVGIWLPWQLKCGGTLIHSCWVLTAAHCFSQPYPTTSYWIRLGDHQTSKIDGTEQDFKIQRLIRHTFNVDSNDNDIALIELKRINGRCAIINEVVKPACLPTSPNQFPAGQKCQIVGWGQTAFQSSTPYTRLLKEATVALISRTDCATRSVYGSSLTNNMFCAGYMRGGVDTCQGDSGGPLLCQATNGRYYVWGIVSWGNGCAKPRAPGVYTVVANYVEWISRNTGLEF